MTSWGLPWVGATRTPGHLWHKAIDMANNEPRRPNRGSWVDVGGRVKILPDGTRAGVPIVPQPVEAPLQALLQKLLKQGKLKPRTWLARKEIIQNLSRQWYVSRDSHRPSVLLSGRATPALYYATRLRPKPGAPGGYQGAKQEVGISRAVGLLAGKLSVPTSLTNSQIGKRGFHKGPAAPTSSRYMPKAPEPTKLTQRRFFTMSNTSDLAQKTNPSIRGSTATGVLLLVAVAGALFLLTRGQST